MTKTIATQAASLALAAIVTLAAFAGVSGIAGQQRVAAETVAMEQAMTQTASIQNVVVIGRRTTRA
jgi:hypothetical protein